MNEELKQARKAFETDEEKLRKAFEADEDQKLASTEWLDYYTCVLVGLWLIKRWISILNLSSLLKTKLSLSLSL